MTSQQNDRASPSRSQAIVRRLVIAVGVVLALWLIWSALGGDLLPVGSKAPGWTLPLADGSGKNLSLDDLEGRVAVLDFWSTTCPPCLKQMEDLTALWRRMKPRGLEVVGVACGGESVAEIESFADGRAVRYPLVVDRTGAVAGAYRVSSLPTLYLIGPDGAIAAAHSGYWPRDDLAAAVSELIEDR
ncbi:MAG: redoxin domain-containing protein [Polyangia bacterium]